jgi:RNAse (barnase) inhibitor barstar
MEQTNHIKDFIAGQSSLETAIKNSSNPFLKNKYADIQEILDKVKSAFHENNYIIVQEGGADESGEFIDTKLIHTSGNLFNCKIYLQYKKGDMQSLGGAITYARRYGLLSVTGIPVDDDDGTSAIGTEAAQAKAMERATKLENWLETKCKSKRDLALQEKNANAVFSGLLEFNKGYAGQLIALWDRKENEIRLGFE